MWIYLLFGIAIGIILDIILGKWMVPYFDVKLEKYTYRETIECTGLQLDAQELVQMYQDKYGLKPELSPAIGYSINSNENFDEDDEEYKKKHRKFGF